MKGFNLDYLRVFTLEWLRLLLLCWDIVALHELSYEIDILGAWIWVCVFRTSCWCSAFVVNESWVNHCANVMAENCSVVFEYSFLTGSSCKIRELFCACLNWLWNKWMETSEVICLYNGQTWTHQLCISQNFSAFSQNLFP